jgi:transposase
MKTKPSQSIKKRSEGPIRPAASMPVINPHAAGIDIGASEHYVCVPADAVSEGQSPVRRFGAFTQDLDQLVEWLRSCGVTSAAMESTGIYWVALYEKLEAAGIAPVLVNARHIRQVPGRKTDVKDCQWLQQLHSYGLLNGSFRPGPEYCRLRTLMRYRANIVEQKTRQVQQMQSSLQQMNVLLHHVVSDLDGDTGFRIVDAILEGERDPAVLVQLRDYRIKRSTVEEMEAALKGRWQDEHLLILKQARNAYKFFEEQMAEGDVSIERVLKALPSAPPNPPPVQPEGAVANPSATPTAAEPVKEKRKRKAGGNAPKQDFLPELIRICGIDLSKLGGLNMLSILILISELGIDMSKWRSEKAFCSWLGLAPGNKISGGRVLSSRTPFVINRISTLLRTLAINIGRTDTWLGSHHRRMRARLGPAAAATATARKLACVIYHLLKTREPYLDINRLVYEEKIRKHRLAKLRKQAEELGLQLVELQKAA